MYCLLLWWRHVLHTRINVILLTTQRRFTNTWCTSAKSRITTTKCGQQIWHTAALQGVDFSYGRQHDVTPISRQHCSPLQQWCHDAVTDFFAAYNITVTCTTFQPSTIALSPWGIWNSINTWLLGPTWVYPPISISTSSALFAWLTNVTNRYKNHATPSVAIGCI